jgi:hypothetical protein
MGQGVVGVLKTNLASRDPEIRQRIQDILEQLISGITRADRDL